ncbi:MAG TPA: class I SAM-dependent rRNA methyltransferase [Thermoanaerobaculia bacterium]
MSAPEPEPARARIRLRAGRERPLRDGHPWLFSGAVAATELAADAPLAEIVAADGAPLGVALHSPRSRLRARMLAPPGTSIDRDFFRARIAAAAALRAELVDSETDGYRLINSEGDALPGWTVDRFADVLVSQITAAGLEALGEVAHAALAALFPEHAVFARNDLAARRQEGLPLIDRWRRGAPRAEVEFRERGLRLVAELAGGQKSGFYCDQRENRALAARLAPGRAVLDLFAHSGAFSLHVLRAGARRAVLVESAERLLALARRQLAANGLPAERAELVAADSFEELRRREERFDLVVCDPPPFARRRADVERAARAYKDLNRLALGRLEPGGFLLTFTCSGAVDGKLFRQILHAAAAEAGVRAQLLAPLAAAPDHPVALAHPEGEYLRGWLARRVDPA